MNSDNSKVLKRGLEVAGRQNGVLKNSRQKKSG